MKNTTNEKIRWIYMAITQIQETEESDLVKKLLKNDTESEKSMNETIIQVLKAIDPAKLTRIYQIGRSKGLYLGEIYTEEENIYNPNKPRDSFNIFQKIAKDNLRKNIEEKYFTGDDSADSWWGKAIKLLINNEAEAFSLVLSENVKTEYNANIRDFLNVIIEDFPEVKEKFEAFKEKNDSK